MSARSRVNHLPNVQLFIDVIKATMSSSTNRSVAQQYPGVLVLGVTGAICAGKSTVSRLLLDIVKGNDNGHSSGSSYDTTNEAAIRDIVKDAIIVDADRLGHEAYRPGTACHRAVVEAFGAEAVLVDEPPTPSTAASSNDASLDTAAAGGVYSWQHREIDRRKLGALVFADASALHRLEALVWPEIRRLAQQRIAAEAAEHHKRRTEEEQHQEQGLLLVVLEAAVMLPAGWYDIPDRLWFVRCSGQEALARLMRRNGLGEADARLRLDRQVRSEEELSHVHVFIDNNDAGTADSSGSGELLRARVAGALRSELDALR